MTLDIIENLREIRLIASQALERVELAADGPADGEVAESIANDVLQCCIDLSRLACLALTHASYTRGFIASDHHGRQEREWEEGGSDDDNDIS